MVKIKLAVFSIFCQNSDRHHRVFIKYQNSDGQHGHDDNIRHRTRLGSTRSSHFWNMAILRFFKMAAVAVLNF